MTQTLTAYVRRATTFVAAAMLIAACSTTPPPVIPDVTSVTIDGGDRTIGLGLTAQLNATVVATGGASDDVSWSTSDAAVVSVDANGVVRGEAVGSAEVTATSTEDGAESDTIVVTVIGNTAVNPDEIFVNASAPAGGNGSASLPFQTIGEGIAAVNAGGDVLVAAGDYSGGIHINKSVNVLGAGVGLVTVTIDEDAPAPFAESAIDIENVNGLTLSGFRLEVVAPGPTIAAIGMRYASGSTNVTIEDVEIVHTNDSQNTRGIDIRNSTAITIINTDIVATSADHSGAGVSVTGNSTNITLNGVTTTGHESFAGVALVPGALSATISDVNISNSTFNEVNKMTVGSSLGGTVTDIDAPMFVAAIGTTAPVYAGGLRFFYKTSITRAILDALFNFNELNTNDGDRPTWLSATVQTLDPVDQSIRLNNFVVGSALDTEYGFGVTRSMFIQGAVDAALPGATIQVFEGIFAGADESSFGGVVANGDVVVDVANVTIQGQGAASIVSAATGPVFTIDADNVTIDGLQIEGALSGILLGTGDLLTVAGSNLLSDVAIDNTAAAAVTAQGNYWGAADGPSGAGAGSGTLLIDPSGGVVYIPFEATALP